MASRGAVQSVSKLLPRLEKGNGFLRDIDRGAGTWVASGTRIATPDRKCAESTQFNPVAAGQGVSNLVENSRDDALDITLVEMRIQFGDLQDQFRFGHKRWLPRTIGLRQR